MYNGIEIKDKKRFIIKHIGYGLLAIGFLLMLGQIFISQKFFPTSTIVLVVAIIFQLFGWKEPQWFLADMSTFRKG